MSEKSDAIAVTDSSQSGTEPPLTRKEFSERLNFLNVRLDSLLTQRELSEELSLTRREMNQTAGMAQGELREQLGHTRQELQEALDGTREALQGALSRTREELQGSLSRTREEMAEASVRMRQEFTDALAKTREEFNGALSLTRTELSKKPGMTFKDWLQIVIMPLLFIVAGVILGAYFQNRSFQKNTLFTKQYERLLSAQQEAAGLYRDLDKQLNEIESLENYGRTDATQCSAENLIPSIEDLKLFKTRGQALKNYAKDAGATSALDEKLKAYADLVDETVTCESGFLADHCKSPCTMTANRLRESLQNVAYTYNDLISDLIKRNN